MTLMREDAHKDRRKISAINQHFYDTLWAKTRLIKADRFNTWPLIQELLTTKPSCLEVGPGMRPRLPTEGTHFADRSQPALDALTEQGGICQNADISDLPYTDNTFDLVCALDIIEHVVDDEAALSELCRVAKPGATVLISTPLHMHYWTDFDDIVGHCRRYDPDTLEKRLHAHNLGVERSCSYGMQPKSNWLVSWAMNYMKKNPERAMAYYNRIFMPIGLFFQKPMQFNAGLAGTATADEVFMICRLG
ncbi:MAG: class I SAM-dependent methyltransferase [Opitutaceae bacterium]